MSRGRREATDLHLEDLRPRAGVPEEESRFAEVADDLVGVVAVDVAADERFSGQGSELGPGARVPQPQAEGVEIADDLIHGVAQGIAQNDALTAVAEAAGAVAGAWFFRLGSEFWSLLAGGIGFMFGAMWFGAGLKQLRGR